MLHSTYTAYNCLVYYIIHPQSPPAACLLPRRHAISQPPTKAYRRHACAPSSTLRRIQIRKYSVCSILSSSRLQQSTLTPSSAENTYSAPGFRRAVHYLTGSSLASQPQTSTRAPARMRARIASSSRASLRHSYSGPRSTGEQTQAACFTRLHRARTRSPLARRQRAPTGRTDAAGKQS